MSRVQKEEQKIYAIMTAFFFGMFFGEILFAFLQERKRHRAIEEYFGNLKV